MKEIYALGLLLLYWWVACIGLLGAIAFGFWAVRRWERRRIRRQLERLCPGTDLGDPAFDRLLRDVLDENNAAAKGAPR